jgi:gas vesicle protein
MEAMSITSSGGYLDRPHSSSLADVLNVILDKGLVIDAYVGVSLLGIQLLTVDARIVVASVDTYLRFAEATSRLDLTKQGGRPLTEIVQKGVENTVEGLARKVAKDKTKDAIETVQQKVEDVVTTVAEKVESAVSHVMDAAENLVGDDDEGQN